MTEEFGCAHMKSSIELNTGDYNGIWEKQAKAINAHKDDELDSFFRFYLKAKFASTRREGQRFDGEYHRTMFTADIDKQLSLSRNPARVKSFLKGEYNYYCKLYLKLLEAYSDPSTIFKHVYYNGLLDLDAPFLLVMSSCELNDPDEDEKINKISYEIDRLISLLQLQSAYDSNDFADALYVISEAIRGKNVNTFRDAFDNQLTTMIAARRNVSQAKSFSYATFKQTGINLNTRYKRYFFARIDEFLASNMNLNQKQPIADLVLKTGAKNGFHVEHILSRNDENLALFSDDEERFEQERNRLGGILLLKGKDNISSNNEPYSEKLKSYANTLYWNETLRSDSYKSKLDMTAFRAKYKLDLKACDSFGPDELEERHKLLFEMAKVIWA